MFKKIGNYVINFLTNFFLYIKKEKNYHSRFSVAQSRIRIVQLLAQFLDRIILGRRLLYIPQLLHFPKIHFCHLVQKFTQKKITKIFEKLKKMRMFSDVSGRRWPAFEEIPFWHTLLLFFMYFWYNFCSRILETCFSWTDLLFWEKN